MQKHNDKFFPIEFFSRQLSASESRYPSIRRELLAIFASCRHFHEYLYGQKFTILTDAKPLTFHMQLDKQPEIVARWLLYLQQFEYSMQHIPGIDNPSDFLSRMTVDQVSVNNVNLFATDNFLSNDNIKIHQSQCNEIKSIIDKINSNDSEIKQKYFIDSFSNLVMVKCKNKSNNVIVNKILLPKSLIKKCLELAHLPHFGTKKTYDSINKKYHWKGIYLDTRNFCENCSQCLSNKAKPKKTASKHIEKSNLGPGEYLALDVVGRLPRSTDGKFFILTIIDHYSRYLEAIPLTNVKSTTIINCLNEYFARFGIAKIIQTDNGTNFTSREFKDFLSNLNIQHRLSSIYMPSSNGLIERVHRTMKESLKSISNDSLKWSENILIFKLHYNNSKHTATQFSPSEIFFGRNTNIPLENSTEPKFVEDFKIYQENIKKSLEEMRNQIAQNEAHYFAVYKQNTKGRAKPKLNLGDKVFLENFNPSCTLSKKYDGPWEIRKIFRNNNYLISKVINQEVHEKKVDVSKIFLQKPLRPNCANSSN